MVKHSRIVGYLGIHFSSLKNKTHKELKMNAGADSGFIISVRYNVI